MEPEAAVRLVSRSEQLGYRYITFVGDGDSASFNAVTALNDGDGPYSVPVVKEECVNHVAKRLGTRLCRLKDSLKIPTQTKGVKTAHRSALAGKKGLPDSVIDKLASYYGQNIRKFPPTGTVEDLRNSILSSYYHATSTDAEPRHTHCDTSFCWVKQAVRDGTRPVSHSKKDLYLAHLSLELRKGIFQVYIELMRPDLLKRCLQKRTQNANESLHSKLWRRCLKVKDCKLDRVRFCAWDTVLMHNFRAARGSLLARFGLSPEEVSEKKRKRDRSMLAQSTPKRARRDEPGTSDDYAPGAF